MDKALKQLLLSLGVTEDAIKDKEDDLSKFEDAEGLKKNRDELIAENRKLKSKTSEQAAEEIEKLVKENQELGSKLKDLGKISKDYEKVKNDLATKDKSLKEMMLDNAVKTAISKYGLDPDETTEIVLKHKHVKFNDAGELQYGDKSDMDEFFTEFVKTDSAKRLLKADALPSDVPMSKPSLQQNKQQDAPSFSKMTSKEKVEYIDSKKQI